MKLSSTSLLASLAIACTAMFSAPAAYAQGTFTLGTGTANNCLGTVSGQAYDTVNCSVGSVTASMQAFGYMSAFSATATAGWQAGRIGDHDGAGFGAYTGSNESTTGNQHAFDSLTTGCGTGSGASGGSNPLSTANAGCGGFAEGLLMNFGTSKVAMSTVGIGFFAGDSDLSVYAWTGGGTGPTMSTQTATSAGVMAGWTLVGSHDMDPTGGSNPFNTGSAVYSSYFMITTYFGATNGVLDQGNDAFKINVVTVGTCSGTVSTAGVCTPGTAPEPGSLGLAAVAILGVGAARRRRFFG